MGSPAAGAEQSILLLCRRHPEGLAAKVLEDELRAYSLQEQAQAINALLQKRLVQLFTKGDTLVYKELDQEEAVKFKGLSSEDMLVYQIIQQAGNMGIWTRDMKLRSNLQQPQITKILKTLEGRHLIKAVKSVASKNRKVYMLIELEPSREITGGAWYTEHEFDAEFIAVLRQQCLQYILHKGAVTLEDVAEAVRLSGVTREELRLEDYQQVQQIVNTLVYDGEVEVVMSSGRDPPFPLMSCHDSKLQAPVGTLYYKPSTSRVPDSTPFTSIPCGVCPVLRDCSDDGLVSPKTCIYFKEWLQF
eukprot:SM000070S21340  [mRNA]  locus=s70:401309:404485:+ [translate_table: standard]